MTPTFSPHARRLALWASAALLGACSDAAPEAPPVPHPEEAVNPAICDYPAGPYGVEEGQVVPPDLTWEGYLPGNTEATSLRMAELHDCNGRRDLHAILFATSQYGCAPCYEESSSLERYMQDWAPLGVSANVLLLDDDDSGPPTISGVSLWRKEFGLESVGVLMDPHFSLVPGDQVGTPMQTVVDPRTMKVVWRVEGLPSSFEALVDLAARNGG